MKRSLPWSRTVAITATAAVLAAGGAVTGAAPALAAPARAASCGDTLSDYAGTYTGTMTETPAFAPLPDIDLGGLFKPGSAPSRSNSPAGDRAAQRSIKLTISGTTATYTLPGQAPKSVSVEKSTNVEYWFIYFSGGYLNRASAKGCDSKGRVTKLWLDSTGEAGTLTRTG